MNLGLLTLPGTNSLHLKMDGCNTSFRLGWPIFRGYVWVCLVDGFQKFLGKRMEFLVLPSLGACIEGM